MSESTKAEKIMDINDQNVITLNEQALHDILMKDNVKEKQVCVISVTGEFRKGKSFLLNFFIKYLQLKEKILLTENQEEWLNLCEEQLFVGFPWKGGSERLTTGILIWPEIFISKLPSGEEIAIILLDTQGSFDNQTTTTHCASIFAISCLISSVQIYNLSEDIKQYYLSHLACFSNYGQIVSNCKQSVFQKLVFLVRDWRWYEQYKYGSSGGQARLDQLIKDSKDSCQELKSQWEIINSLFKDKSCFLMPYPGSKVATKVNSNITDMKLLFKKHLQKFVVNILTPKNLVPKTNLNGDNILVGDLFYYIKTYCQRFRNSDLPEPQSMYMAACEAHYRNVMEKSEAIYDDLMKNILDENSEPLGVQFFITQHYDSATKAVAFFSKQKMMGDVDSREKYMKIFENILQKKLPAFITINSLKQKNKDKDRANKNTLVSIANSVYDYCGKPIHAFRKCFVAIKNDINNKSIRNTAEALPKLGGTLGGGSLGFSAAVNVGEILIQTALGPVGTIAIVLCSFYIGSYGGYRIVSSATKSLYDALGFGIITRECVFCKQKFQFRKYKGENFIGCFTCAKEIYKQ